MCAHPPADGPPRVVLCGFSPLLWMDRDGSWLVQPLRDDDIAEGPVQPGHLDDIEALVRPVDVSCREGTVNTRMSPAPQLPTPLLPAPHPISPAIQSTAMPSTRPMPLVTTSSRHVWSRLARLMVLRPMSTQ